jgi:hypothetical protein
MTKESHSSNVPSRPFQVRVTVGMNRLINTNASYVYLLFARQRASHAEHVIGVVIRSPMWTPTNAIGTMAGQAPNFMSFLLS